MENFILRKIAKIVLFFGFCKENLLQDKMNKYALSVKGVLKIVNCMC